MVNGSKKFMYFIKYVIYVYVDIYKGILTFACMNVYFYVPMYTYIHISIDVFHVCVSKNGWETRISNFDLWK